MRKLLFLLLLASPLAAQTPYVPTCLQPPDQATISANASALAPLLSIDLTDPLMRLADQQCTLKVTTVGALANIQALNLKVATLQAQQIALQTQISSIPAGATGPQGAQGIQGNPGPPGPQGPPGPAGGTTLTPVTQVAADKAVLSVPTMVAGSTSDAGSLDGQKVTLAAGQVLTYNFILQAAGTFSPYARLCNAQGSTSSMTAHFELTPGVLLGSELTLAAGLQWTVVSSSAVALPGGSVSLRLVIDSVAAGGGSFADIAGLK